jgi:hypothetical protein
VQKDEKTGLINITGRLTVPLLYDNLFFTGTGLLRAQLSGKWGLIHTDHTVILPPEYQFLSDFNEGKAVAVKNNKAFLVYDDGRLSSFSFSFSSPASRLMCREGWLVFKNQGRVAVADTSGKLSAFPFYDDAGYFSEGLLAVKKGSRWGYADRSGKLKIPLRFESAGAFYRGLAIVRSNKLYGVIDTAGNFRMPALYRKVEIKNYGIEVTSSTGKGLMSPDGKMLIEPEYEKLYLAGHQIIAAAREEEIHYFSLSTQQYIYRTKP